jgi:hypothetical protein
MRARQLAEVEGLVETARGQGVTLRVCNGTLLYSSRSGPLDGPLRNELLQRKTELLDLFSGPCYSASRQGVTPILESYRSLWRKLQSNADPRYASGTHVVVHLGDRMDIKAFEASVGRVIERHSVLTARVIETPDGPAFDLHTPWKVSVRVVEVIPDGSIDERMRQAKKVASDIVWKSFDFDSEPFFRAFVIRVSESSHLVGFVVHHFIADHASVQVLSAELFGTYAEYLLRTPAPPRSPPLQYVDYVFGMNRWFSSLNAARRLEFWKSNLSNAPACLIPPDKIPATSEPGALRLRVFRLSAELSSALHNVAVSYNVSLFHLILAVHMSVLAFLCDSSDVAVWNTIDGRDEVCLRDMVGAASYIIALRVSVNENDPFRDFLTQVRDVALRAYTNRLPLYFVKKVLPEVGGSSFFGQFNFVDARASARTRSPAAEPLPRWRPFDLFPARQTWIAGYYPQHEMVIHCQDRGIVGQHQYWESLYSEAYIERVVSMFCGVVNSIARDSSQSVGALLAALRNQ